MYHITAHLKTGIEKSDFHKTYHASEWLAKLKSKSDGMVSVKVTRTKALHHFKNISNCISWLNLQKTD
jgi:hypothetical protein